MRPVYYVATSYRDGAAVACHPQRKPSDRKLKQDGDRVDPDLVFREYHYGSDEFSRWELDFRVRCSDLLANRLNMRRAAREIVLPKLDELDSKLQALHKQLQRIESLLAASQKTS
jgi:hypothetical protein